MSDSTGSDKADYRSFSIKNPTNTGVSESNEHFFEHFKMGKRYSTGVFKGYKGAWSKLSKQEKTAALRKRWYVRWSYRSPITGKLERQDNIYGGVNRYNTHSERIEILKVLERNLIVLLKSGMNPYDEDLEIEQTPSVFKAIDDAMAIKKLHMKPSSFIRFKSDINKFKKYLKSKGYERRFVTSVTKKTITGYLNEVLKDVSARSRNNYKTSIGSIWQTMENEGIVEKNFVSTIPMLKSIPQRNKTYTDAQVEELFAYMDNNYPNLLLFIKFVSYNFLRPIEVCRLKVDSINMQDKTLNVMVKQGRMKTKTIPELLLNELPDMNNKSGFLFAKDGLFGEWKISEDSKRGHFSRQFKKVKEHFGLGNEYGIYSFRHYYTTKLYREFRKKLSPYETKSKLMLVTGHESMKALEKYLRSIDVELSEDYSEMLT